MSPLSKLKLIQEKKSLALLTTESLLHRGGQKQRICQMVTQSCPSYKRTPGQKRMMRARKHRSHGVPEKIILKLMTKKPLTIEEGKLMKTSSKAQVNFVCKLCQKESLSQVRKLAQRSHNLAWEPICNICIMKAVTNTEEWRKKNSDSQLIAQNKPSQRLRNSLGQLAAHKKDKTLAWRKGKAARNRTPEQNQRIRDMFLKRHRERKESDPDYAEKFKPSGYVSGWINSIPFDSSLELYYILFCLRNNMSIKRASFRIKMSRNRIYNPDFLVEEKTVVETKGRWSGSPHTEEKARAAIEYLTPLGISYVIYHKKDLEEIGAMEMDWDHFNDQRIKFNMNPATQKWYKKYQLYITKGKSTIFKYRIRAVTT